MTSGIPGASSRDLLQPLTEELGAVVHREVERMRQELTRPYGESRAGVRLLGGSVVLGSMSAGSATALVIRLLDRRMPPMASAAVATTVFAVGASVMAAAGRTRMRMARGSAPQGSAT
jgi:Putative Actinobacterial Holin-X, holin superfamily III